LTGFRIGGSEDTGADKEAFGASTLLGKHISVDGTKVSFSFTGKKGVHIQKTVTDEQLATFLSAKKRKSGVEGRIFDVSDAQARAYLKAASGKNFKVKDFRTWHGTAKAVKELKAELKKNPTPSAAEAKKVKLAVAKKVAAHLGNTPAIALASYIAPEVWGALEGV
jgi:DNA topoisomerase-1